MGEKSLIGVVGLLLVLFIALKLLHVIAWAWLWVLAPIWISFVAVLLLVVLVSFVTLIRRG